MIEIQVGNARSDKIRIVDANGEITEYDLREELIINEHNLNDDILSQSAKYVYWTSILAQVKGFLEASELAVEQVRAHLYDKGWEHYTLKGIKKPTKDQIEAFITMQVDYIDARQQLIAYQEHELRLRYIVRAFEQRKDMLVQISADNRKQMDYEAAIRQI